MSRNLCQQDCAWCEGKVAVTGNPAHLPDDHFSRPGMLAADAECQECGARYTAWVGPCPRKHGDGNYGGRDIDRQLIREFGFFDLSYRSTFNDEPGKADVPPFGKSAVDFPKITREVSTS